MIAGAASLAGGGAYLSGAIGAGEYYDMPSAEISAKLAQMPLPEELGNSTSPGDQLQLVELHATSEKVQWQLLLGGNTLADVDANLAPTWTGGTRVSIDFRAAPEGESNQQIVSSLPLDTEFMDRVIELAIGEQADSYLENRPFDRHKLMSAVAGYTATHPDKALEFRKRVNEMDVHSPHRDDPDDYAARDYGAEDYAASRDTFDPSYGRGTPARGTPATPDGAGWKGN